MNHHRVWLSALGLMTALIACGSETEGEEVGNQFGPICEKYYGSGNCCVELAGDTDAGKQACATAKAATLDGMGQGQPASNFESACQAALDTAEMAGKSCTGGGESGGGQLSDTCERYFSECCPKVEGDCDALKKAVVDAIAAGKFTSAKADDECRKELEYYEECQ